MTLGPVVPCWQNPATHGLVSHQIRSSRISLREVPRHVAAVDDLGQYLKGHGWNPDPLGLDVKLLITHPCCVLDVDRKHALAPSKHSGGLKFVNVQMGRSRGKLSE